MSDTGENEVMRWGDEIYREEERIKKDAREIAERIKKVKEKIGNKEYDGGWGRHGLEGHTKYSHVDMEAIQEEKTEEEVIKLIKRAENKWRGEKFEELMRGEAKISEMMEVAKWVTGEKGVDQLIGWLADLHETHYAYRYKYQAIRDKYLESMEEYVNKLDDEWQEKKDARRARWLAKQPKTEPDHSAKYFWLVVLAVIFAWVVVWWYKNR